MTVRTNPARSRTRLAAAAVTGALALGALAACSDDSSSNAGEKTTTQARTADPGKPQSEEKVDKLNVGLIGEVLSLHPTENVGSGLYVNSLMFESLLRLDDEGKIQPWLASDYKQVSNTVWEYTLRDGIKFWDGTDLTAEDVKFSWDQRLAGKPGANPFFGSVKQVDAVDAKTVRVTLSKPDASWRFTPAQYYSNVHEKAFFEKQGAKYGQPGTLGMGTGPWQVKSFNPTTGIELTAYDGYWGGKAPIAQISVKSFADDNSMALALRAGEIDVAPFVGGPRGFDAAAGGGTTTTVATCATALLSMPTTRAPWNDPQVRKAVAYAINRDDIVAATGGRAGAPLNTLSSDILLSSLGSKDTVDSALKKVPVYAHDVAKAEEALKASKHADGVKGEFVTDGTQNDVVQVIVAQLKKAGIDLKIKQVSAAEYGGLLTGPANKRPVTYTETGTCSPDPSWNDIFLGSTGPLNIASYDAPGIDDLLAKGLSTQDEAERLGIYTDLLTKVNEDVPYVPLYSEGTTYASKDFNIFDYDSYYLSEPWALNLVRK